MTQHRIQHTAHDTKGVSFIEEQGRHIAEMTYSRAGATLVIIDHTDVDSSLRGTGAGLALVEAAVQWARDNQLKVIPLCPFAQSVFRKHEHLRDVLN